MDRGENYYKKLAELIDLPIDRNDILTKRFGAPMKKMTYRECAIEHLKQGNLCKAYTDYILGEMAKLEQIEQIVDTWNNDASNTFSDMCKINKLIKQE
jgi:hypothetical protein